MGLSNLVFRLQCTYIEMCLCLFLTGGHLPIEIAAHNNRRKDVEILFPVTSRIPYVHDWSVDGILAYVKSVPKEEVRA